LYEVSKTIGEGLVAMGKSSDAEPTTFSKDEIDKYFNVSDRSNIVVYEPA
jgi:hypothetical protein